MLRQARIGLVLSQNDVDYQTNNFDSIISISKSKITYLGENGNLEHIVPKECSKLWFNYYHKNDTFPLIGRVRNKFIGNRQWNIGDKSAITLFNDERVEFIIETPADRNPSGKT